MEIEGLNSFNVGSERFNLHNRLILSYVGLNYTKEDTKEYMSLTFILSAVILASLNLCIALGK